MAVALGLAGLIGEHCGQLHHNALGGRWRLLVERPLPRARVGLDDVATRTPSAPRCLAGSTPSLLARRHAASKSKPSPRLAARCTLRAAKKPGSPVVEA